LLCDPNGKLTNEGELLLADLAKFCRAHDPPTRTNAQGEVDMLATMEVVGMHKLYGRIRALILLDENHSLRLRMQQWTTNEEDT
jgi:hypothetical protein